MEPIKLGYMEAVTARAALVKSYNEKARRKVKRPSSTRMMEMGTMKTAVDVLTRAIDAHEREVKASLDT